MTLRKWHADELKKYSFIDNAELTGGKLVIHYTTSEGRQTKTLPMRANGEQLQATITKIRNQVGVSKYGKGQHGAIFTSAD